VIGGESIQVSMLHSLTHAFYIFTDEVPEESYTDARFSLKSRWTKSVVTKEGQVCWVHPEHDAAVQCILCLRCQVDKKRSYHCSAECLKEHWHFHVDFHNHHRNNAEAQGALSKQNSSAVLNGLRSPGDLMHLAGGYNSVNGETWMEVGNQRCYVPTQEDVGCVLRYECTAYDSASAYPDMGKTFSILTSRVRPAAPCPNRSMVYMKPLRPTVRRGRFTVLSYNLLADLYASAEQFGYCPSWALHWPYRRSNLLRELLAYNADILCLQEVQSTHFTDFFAPELARAGYTAIFKRKTNEMYTRDTYAIDGCATFFKKKKFALVKKYEVEFNKAALSLAESLPSEQKNTALSRLLKDNVALIAVLEALVPPRIPKVAEHENNSASPRNVQSRRQLICIANTHIHSNPELSDIKLWQVHTLLKGLEKISASADIPMLVAGDFNSVPGSAAHTLLVNGSVPLDAMELGNDPLGILKPAAKLCHHLPLASAYGSFVHGSEDNGDPAITRLRRRLDTVKHEPKFTNCTRDFKGTLDYILYSRDFLVPSGCLELPDESEVRSRKSTGGGMPNESWSSDHIALMSEFSYLVPDGAQIPPDDDDDDDDDEPVESPPTTPQRMY
jgi:CCR4-NOT transcription complex subunit 6